jgi:hypothetical protein
MTCYIDIILQNDTTEWLTLNSVTLASEGQDVFLSDSSYTVGPSSQSQVVTNSSLSNQMIFNITESATLTLGWTLVDHDSFTVTAPVQGTTEYTATGYNGPPVKTYGSANQPIFTYTITLSSTSS